MKKFFLVLAVTLVLTGCSNQSAWTPLERLAKPITYSTAPTCNTVDLLLVNGRGSGYRITAEVPSGGGEQFAGQLLAALDVSASPVPSPTSGSM